MADPGTWALIGMAIKGAAVAAATAVKSAAVAHPFIAGGVAIGATGTAISVPVAVHQANEQRRYQQTMQQRQADIARQNAELVQRQAEARAKQIGANADRVRAAQLTQMAGTGIDIINSNFMDIIGESAANQEFDILNARYSGQLAARQHTLSNQESLMRIDNLESQMQNPLLMGTIATTKYIGNSAVGAINNGYITSKPSGIANLSSKMSYTGELPTIV